MKKTSVKMFEKSLIAALQRDGRKEHRRIEDKNLNVTKLSKIEVPLLLKTFNGEVELSNLHGVGSKSQYIKQHRNERGLMRRFIFEL